MWPGYNFPHTESGALNMDWIIHMMKDFAAQLANFVSLNSIKYANPFQWNITSQYAQNTLVMDPEDGTAYLSIQPVPSGVQITNTNYWTPVFTLQNFLDVLKTAITRKIPLQENGAAATQEITANSVFFVGDVLCTNNQTIPVTSLVVIGTNCTQVSIVELIGAISDKIANVEGDITNIKSDIKSVITNIKSDIEAEQQTREQADTALQNNIDDLSVFITPEMYGAKGDGTTDDTVEVQAAFNAATANKPIILTGQYYCTGTITVKRDTTVIGAASRPRAILIPYFIFNNGVSPAFSVVGTQDEDVDYGGTLENVTFKGVTIALKNAATSACVAFQVQWARFFTLDHCSVYGFTTAVNFANCNGITVQHFEHSTNGAVNVTVFNKFNTGGNTGLKLQHITVNNFSEGITKANVLSDTTADGQAGDRWYEDWLCVGKWNTVIYYTHGNGFSRHVFINRIFADNLLDNLVYLVGSGANEDAQITISGAWVHPGSTED